MNHACVPLTFYPCYAPATAWLQHLPSKNWNLLFWKPDSYMYFLKWYHWDQWLEEADITLSSIFFNGSV